MLHSLSSQPVAKALASSSGSKQVAPIAAPRASPCLTHRIAGRRMGQAVSRRTPSVKAQAQAVQKVGEAKYMEPKDGPAILDDIDCCIFDCDGECVRMGSRQGEVN